MLTPRYNTITNTMNPIKPYRDRRGLWGGLDLLGVAALLLEVPEDWSQPSDGVEDI
jgi:hypothetical protein